MWMVSLLWWFVCRLRGGINGGGLVMIAIPGPMSHHVDDSFGVVTTEITCTACGGHLGYVFNGEGFNTPGERELCLKGRHRQLSQSSGWASLRQFRPLKLHFCQIFLPIYSYARPYLEYWGKTGSVVQYIYTHIGYHIRHGLPREAFSSSSFAWDCKYHPCSIYGK